MLRRSFITRLRRFEMCCSCRLLIPRRALTQTGVMAQALEGRSSIQGVGFIQITMYVHAREKFIIIFSYSLSSFNSVFGAFADDIRSLERRTCSNAGECCYLARWLGLSVRRGRGFCSSKNYQIHTSEETTHTQLECFAHSGRSC